VSDDKREGGALPPTPPDLPGIVLSDLSNLRSPFDGMGGEEQDRLVNLMERYIALEETKENNKLSEANNQRDIEKGRQGLALAALASVVIIVLSCLGYAGMTKDNTLPEKVIATMIGVLGGGGAAVAFVKKSS
jgi:hypothetical protein